MSDHAWDILSEEADSFVDDLVRKLEQSRDRASESVEGAVKSMEEIGRALEKYERTTDYNPTTDYNSKTEAKAEDY